MNCFFCNNSIKANSPNKRKTGGHWAHKICPGKKSYKKIEREKRKKE